jgi:uncharacterized RDD family membrane protein YckC
MSTENPDNDPFRKRDPSEQPSEEPREPPPSSSPYGNPPPGPGGPYGGPLPPPPGGYGPYGTQGSPYGGGGAPGAEGPYGQDPLAGMPPLPSRGRRFLARVIDWLIIFVPVYLVAVPVVAAGYDYGGTADTTFGSGNSYWVGFVGWILYFIYEGLMLSWRGQTVGKMALKIRVAMLQNGAVPDAGAAWARSAVYALPLIVPCVGIIFWFINVLSCTWDRPYRQCVHDKAAKTVVVPAE